MRRGRRGATTIARRRRIDDRQIAGRPRDVDDGRSLDEPRAPGTAVAHALFGTQTSKKIDA